MNDRPLSVSSVNLYNVCPSKYYFRYIARVLTEEVDTQAQQRGSLFHEGIAAALGYGDERSNLEYATAACYEYASKNNIGDALRDSAIELLRYYMPLIGVNRTIFAYEHAGKPMIEHQFDETVDGIPVRGTIDLVAKHADGRILLIDWKCKRELYDTTAIALDKQLYMYAKYVRDFLGIPLDGAMQVQLSTELPAVPRMKLNGEPYKTMGKTTKAAFDASISHLTDEQKRSAILQYADKIAPDTDFIRYSKIDMAMVDAMFVLFLLQAREVRADDMYLPILDAFACSKCSYKDHCYSRIKSRL
jgi:RecB family exonuclease